MLPRGRYHARHIIRTTDVSQPSWRVRAVHDRIEPGRIIHDVHTVIVVHSGMADGRARDGWASHLEECDVHQT